MGDLSVDEMLSVTSAKYDKVPRTTHSTVDDADVVGQLSFARGRGVSERVIELAGELMRDSDATTYIRAAGTLHGLAQHGFPTLEQEAIAEVELRVLGAGSPLDLSVAIARQSAIELANTISEVTSGETADIEVDAMLDTARKQFGR